MTYVIHAGILSIRSPEGVIIDICQVSNGSSTNLELANLDFRVVCNRRLSIFRRNNNLEHTKWILLHGMRFSTPVICHASVKLSKQAAQGRNTEFTNKECFRSIRRPFPISNVVLLVHIETKPLFSLVSSESGTGWHDVYKLC